MDKKIKGLEHAINICLKDDAEKVLTMMKNANFYTNPHPYVDKYKKDNGLLLYTLDVYENIMAKVEDSKWKERFANSNVSNEDLAIVSILHSLVFAFLIEKKDDSYIKKDSLPLGLEGERAIILLLTKQVLLSSEQMYAIRWFNCLEKGDLTKAVNHPLCFALSEAVAEAIL